MVASSRPGRLSIFVLALWASTLATFVSSARANDPLTFAGPTQGTTFRVRLGELPPAFTLDELRAQVESLLAEIDRHMSTYHEETDVAKFNGRLSSDWQIVSLDVATVVSAALAVHERSRGAFDVTVAPLVELWGFGPGTPRERVPTSEEIAQARRQLGCREIEVRAAPPALRKRRPELRINLNGIAPGYAVDAVAGCLEQHQVFNYLVELGGEIRTRGNTPEGHPWRVGLAWPGESSAGIMRVIEPGRGAISTSGDAHQYFERHGRRYSHLMDPRTGAPVAHELASVSVVMSDCMLADAWATALFVLGPEEGPRVAEAEKLAAYFVIRNEASGRATTEFARRFPAVEGERVAPPEFIANEPRKEIPGWGTLAAGMSLLILAGFALTGLGMLGRWFNRPG